MAFINFEDQTVSGSKQNVEFVVTKMTAVETISSSPTLSSLTSFLFTSKSPIFHLGTLLSRIEDIPALFAIICSHVTKFNATTSKKKCRNIHTFIFLF